MQHWQTDRRRLSDGKVPDEPYFRQAYDFCVQWLAGVEKYTVHTSGSTGVPKPIQISRSQMLASARLTAEALDLSTKGGTALVCLNVNYIAGMMMLVRGLNFDWKMTIVAPGANPLASVPAEATYDFAAMVPLQLATMIEQQGTRNGADRFGKILLGGAPVSLALERDVAILDVPVYHSYGMTETVSHVALRRLNGSSPEQDYQILGDIELGTDARDCLWVRGAVTAFTKVQTNDRVAITSHRTFTWLGRADSVINSGGVKIQLEKVDRVVEEVLLEMGSGTNYFAWHEFDETLGQKLVLFMQDKSQVPNEKVLLEKLGTRLTRYETPKAVYFVQNFERTPTDKLDRRATAAAYLKDHTT